MGNNCIITKMNTIDTFSWIYVDYSVAFNAHNFITHRLT